MKGETMKKIGIIVAVLFAFGCEPLPVQTPLSSDVPEQPDSPLVIALDAGAEAATVVPVYGPMLVMGIGFLAAVARAVQNRKNTKKLARTLVAASSPENTIDMNSVETKAVLNEMGPANKKMIAEAKGKFKTSPI
jgi:hypothetical protein